MASPAAWRSVVNEILRARLGAGERIWLPVRGSSMLPLLTRGSRVGIARADRVRFGDLVAYECEGSVVCHRVIGRRGGALLARADHRGAGPDVVARTQVLGVVSALERRGVTVDLATPRQRALATLAAARSFAAATWSAVRRRAWPRT
jgi:hypothetical protein